MDGRAGRKEELRGVFVLNLNMLCGTEARREKCCNEMARIYLEEERGEPVSRLSGCDLSMPRFLYEFAISCGSTANNRAQQPYSSAG